MKKQITELIEKGPLIALWNIISFLGTILGLVNLFQDVVTWKSILPELIEVYKSIVYFPFLFFHLKFNPRIVDYFFIGSMCGMALVKAIDYAEKRGILRTHGIPNVARAFYFFLTLTTWPLGIIIATKQVFFGDEDKNEVEIKKRFLQWLFSIAIVFILILIGNSFLK